MRDNYCRKSRQGKQSQKHSHQKIYSSEDCSRRWGLRGDNHDHRQACAISGQSIWGWDWSHHLENCWYSPWGESAGQSDLWYHFERQDAVHDIKLHLLCFVWSFMAGTRRSRTQENHRAACNTFRICKDASCEPYIRVNSANGFWPHIHFRYFCIATDWECERGISIYQQSQLRSTEAQAHWLVYWSWLYGRTTVVSCPLRLVRYCLCKKFQATISCL